MSCLERRRTRLPRLSGATGWSERRNVPESGFRFHLLQWFLPGEGRRDYSKKSPGSSGESRCSQRDPQRPCLSRSGVKRHVIRFHEPVQGSRSVASGIAGRFFYTLLETGPSTEMKSGMTFSGTTPMPWPLQRRSLTAF